jgi:hypothetical protein
MYVTGSLGKAAGKLQALAAIDHALLWAEKAAAAGVPISTRIPQLIGQESFTRARENMDIFERQRLIITGYTDVLRVRGFGSDGAEASGKQASCGEQQASRAVALVSVTRARYSCHSECLGFAKFPINYILLSTLECFGTVASRLLVWPFCYGGLSYPNSILAATVLLISFLSTLTKMEELYSHPRYVVPLGYLIIRIASNLSVM